MSAYSQKRTFSARPISHFRTYKRIIGTRLSAPARLVMRIAATVVLVLALAPFLQACGPGPGGCSREEAPEFSATEEQITRSDVVAVVGEPDETIEIEDGRVDVYEYDRFCAGIIFLVLPLPLALVKDQLLTVEYGPDGSFLTAQVWPDTETPEDIKRFFKLASERRVEEAERRVKLESCNLPFSEAIQLDAPTQHYLGTYCPGGVDPDAGPLRWQWTCLAAHGLYRAAQRSMAYNGLRVRGCRHGRHATAWRRRRAPPQGRNRPAVRQFRARSD